MSAHTAWRQLMAYLRAVAGMPDYEAYLVHLRRAHPERAPLSREQHFAQHMEQRYTGVSRCC